MTWTYQGHPIHLEERGHGSHTILCVHGMAADHRLPMGAMEPLFDEDSPFRRVYIDLPGMGATAPDPSLASSDALVALLAALAKDLGPTVSLWGQSYGGYLVRGCLQALRDQGWADHVRGLCLVCPVVRPDQGMRDLDDRTEEFWDRDFLGTLDPKDRARFLRNDVRADKATWERFSKEVLPAIALADRGFVSQLRAHYALAEDPDAALTADPFRGPTLVLCGRQDPVVGCRDAWRLEPEFPHGTFAMVDGAGHDLQLERPELFSAAVKEWLRRLMD